MILSDIFDPLTQQSHDWVVTASSQCNSFLQWPLSSRPSPYDLRQWKKYIYLLCKGQRTSFYELGIPLPKSPLSTTATYPPSTASSLPSFIDQLPPFLLVFMQDTNIGSPINDTNIHQISQWLQEDTLIAASDGSEINGNGAHACGFTTKSIATQIFGSAMRTPGNPKEMSSLRAEHAGIITLLLYLQYF